MENNLQTPTATPVVKFRNDGDPRDSFKMWAVLLNGVEHGVVVKFPRITVWEWAYSGVKLTAYSAADLKKLIVLWVAKNGFPTK